MSRKIVNDDWEVIDEIGEGDRILRASSIRNFKNAKFTRLNNKESFVKLYTKCLFDVSHELNGREYSLLFYLLQFLRYNDCILAHLNGKYLTREFIINDLGQSESTVDRAMKGLIKLGIVAKVNSLDQWYYTVNPYLFMKGDKVVTDIAKFYKETRWAKKYENLK